MGSQPASALPSIAGGPAGNARLTAWVGVILLGLFALQGVTLLSLGGLISVHLFVGGVLIPIVLLKLATTSWRMTRYYRGAHPYVAAGRPPLPLRLLGPLVVLTSLAVLGTGLALAFVGHRADGPFTTIAGFGVSALTLHQASAIAWIAATAPHVLARLLPAVRLTTPVGGRRRVRGAGLRFAAIALTAGIAVTTGFLVLHVGVDWTAHSTAALVPGQ
ncbi:MAG TPA: hypothetical protein VHV76_14010 [Mycobacteriales bacterium]|nr:hypothetical protein [Mycobacteriales bacterium]